MTQIINGTPVADNLTGTDPGDPSNPDGIDVINGLDGNDTLVGRGERHHRQRRRRRPAGERRRRRHPDGRSRHRHGGLRAVDRRRVRRVGDGIGSGGDAEGDTLSGIENLIGSAFNDLLGGDAGANVIIGGEGDDQLAGFGGADTLDGGAGVDTVFTSPPSPPGCRCS